MKIAIIVAYFGQMPNYYQLFLDSCKSNVGYEWLIFSDDDTYYEYPDNVHLIKMSFEECHQLIQSKFDFKICLNKPQKLCDFKCAYGVVFEEYLKEYQWWGHCDLDQIFGCLNNFITDEMLRNHDKIFSLGHLTLYRNTFENNRVFMRKLEGKERYKEVFTTERGCGFDEWLPGNVNEIYLQSNRPVFYENMGADINPYRTTLETVRFDIESYTYQSGGVKNSVFLIENGSVYQLYFSKGEVVKKEYPYVHLQKRKMKDLCKDKNNGFYIIPNCFIDTNREVKKIIQQASFWRIINYQYFIVKFNSLKYRIKNADWKFTNVFK